MKKQIIIIQEEDGSIKFNNNGFTSIEIIGIFEIHKKDVLDQVLAQIDLNRENNNKES